MHDSAFSVVIVSDYESDAAGAGQRLRRALSTLAAQDRGEAAEFIYVKNPSEERRTCDDLTAVLPRLRVVSDPTSSSYGRRNAGVRAAATPWIAMLDADCVPGEGWLQTVGRTIRANPSAAAISGRTRYPGGGVAERILALLSRSYVDRGAAGPTRFIAMHQCVFQRQKYLRFPLPTAAGVYAARVQSDAMQREHEVLWFDPALECTHNFEGWGMERDIRRNTGHSTVFVRLYDETLPYSWLIRLGPITIPAIVAGKIWLNWLDCVRCRSYYGVSLLHLPLALAMAVWVHLFEIGGMLTAFRGRPITNTAYQ